MLDRQQKRPRPLLDNSQLSLTDHQALQHVAQLAQLLNKPVAELLEEVPRHTNTGASNTAEDPRPSVDITFPNTQSWQVPVTQWHSMDNCQHNIDFGGTFNRVSGPNGPWTQSSGTIFEEENPSDVTLNQWPGDMNYIPVTELASSGYSDNIQRGRLDRSPNWSHEASLEEPWVSVPTDFLTQIDSQSRVIDFYEIGTSLSSTGEGKATSSYDITPPDGCSASSAFGPRQDRETMDQTSIRSASSPSGDLPDGDVIELGWIDLKPEVPSYGSQPASLVEATTSGWSMAELSKPHDTFLLDKSTPDSIQWVSADPSGKELLSQKPQRRGPFQDQQLREETSNTRKSKACIRCRMQKIRCQPNSSDPSGICVTCQGVSKQKIHTLPCVRYKLTECTLYRTGKAPGLEFTLRWPEMKLRDISEWSDTKIRTIKVMSDVCDIPLELSVRRFVPIPEDSLQKSWMDGKVKKFKETTPYAIVNMSATVKEMEKYIYRHVSRCMEFWLKGRDPWIQETYKFAWQYTKKAPTEEKSLLEAFFRLWFAVRRTATMEHIVGDDTLDMQPVNDPSYPLNNKVPLPPVMIQQLDMILTLGFLQPLRKKVLEDFQKIVLNNKPKSWMTIYLITFMSLHSCATLTAENFQNAKKHGLKRRFAMPKFISERHHSANVFLLHYHYCTKPCNPFKIDWRKRNANLFSEMTIDEIHFLLRTSEMREERKDNIRYSRQVHLYEDDLYFVSQMFEEDWAPRDTIIEYSDETISDVLLKQYGSPKGNDKA